MNYERIRQLREDRDLSQKEVAHYLCVSQNTYSRYETSARQVPLEIMDRLADYYHTSVDFLMGRTDVPAPYPLGNAKKSGHQS